MSAVTQTTDPHYPGVEGTFSLKHSGYQSCALVVKEGREVVVTGGYSSGSTHGSVDR